MVEGNNDFQVLIPFHLMVEPRGGLETQNVREVQKQATYSCIYMESKLKSAPYSALIDVGNFDNVWDYN